MVHSTKDWEMAEFRSYKQKDMDGDGVADAVLLTTFEHGMIWRRVLFVCLSTAPLKVMHREMGGKGERLAEGFEITKGTIIVKGKQYADSDAMCCPSQPFQTVFVVTNGDLLERH